MDASIPILVLAALLVLLGLAGMVLPAMPGAPVLFAGLLLAAWAEDFRYVGVWMLGGLGFLAALTYLADFVAGALGAKKFGASRRAIIGATLGALVGLFFGLPGILFGPFVGAVIGELSARPDDVRAAGLAGLGATLGLALGLAAKLALGFTMIGLFLLARFTGS